MFARPSRSTFVCFKCQSRQAPKAPRGQWLASRDWFRSQPQKRWQSAAAAVAEDAQDHQDDSVSPRAGLQLDRKHLHTYKGEKVWKPKPTADLGVQSLGKPAEVLLLSERDRPIPKAPAELEEVREGDVLPQAWNTENMSLSPEQLTKNIEQIRDQVTQSLEKANEGQLKDFRQKLQHGFSGKQLLSYIEQQEGVAAKPFRQKPYSKKFKFSVKHQMARYIFKHVWGFQGPEAAESSEVAETEESRELIVPINVLEVLLVADHSNIRQISLDHKVRIDFFRQPAKIVISGPSRYVRGAQTALAGLRKKVMSKSIFIGDRQKVEFDVDQPSLLAEIRQRHTVHLQGLKREVVVYYHVDTPPDLLAIKRRLLLAQRRVTQPTSHCIMWPKFERESLLKVHVNPLSTIANSAQDRGKRFVSSEEQLATPSIPQMSDQQEKSFSEVYKSTRNALSTFNAKLARLNMTQAGFRIETKASFGQALVSNRIREPNLMDKAVIGAEVSLITQIPLLAQFLANRKPWKGSPSQDRSSTEVINSIHYDGIKETYPKEASNQFRFELVLNPVRNHICLEFPRLQIQLAGADASQGLKQPLQIKQISAVLAEQTSYLLLPSKAVDIKFESQLIREVYHYGRQPDVAYDKLLSQLAEYFRSAASEVEPKFSPFTKLSMPFVLKSKQGLDLFKKSDADPVPEQDYVLTSAEALDSSSYRLPFTSNLCLDHVVLMDDDRKDGRQLLQLVEQSRLSMTSTKKKTSFASFFNSAYETALLLGDAALLRKT